MAAIGLGGGRRKTGDVIDPAVGFSAFRPVGARVEAGEAVAQVHAKNGADADAAIAALADAITIADAPPTLNDVVLARVASRI